MNDILKELDANGDGKISQGEFEALVVDVVKLIEEDKTGKKVEQWTLIVKHKFISNESSSSYFSSILIITKHFVVWFLYL